MLHSSGFRMCIAYILIKLWTGKFFGFLAPSSYRQNLEMRITRIRNTRALKKSKQADKRKQKKFARTRRTPQWNIDPEYFRAIAKQKKIYEKIRQELEIIKMTRKRKSRVKQKLKRKGRSRS